MSETQTAVNAIEMHGIVMEFSGVRALDGVDFSLRQGQVMGLVGKNGAGKSTLMKIINGVYTQTAGTVQFFGKNIDKSVSVREREQTVAMIYQDYSLVGEMTVAENIFLNAEPIRGALISDRDCIRKAAEFFRDMGIRIDPRQKVKSLSTGDMQMVEIAKAIMKQTKIILMDEPTSALDPQLTQEVLSVIRQLADEKRTMIVVTHEMNFAREVGDRVVFMHQGRVWEQGDSKTLFANPQTNELKQFISSVRGLN